MDTFVNFTEWRKQGLQLRRAMEAERKALLQKLAAIERTLAELPKEGADNTSSINTPRVNGTLLSADASVPELVGAVLEGVDKPLNAGEIISRIQQLRKGVDAANIHSAISRLTRDERLDAFGNVGARTYAIHGTFIPPDHQPEEEQADR